MLEKPNKQPLRAMLINKRLRLRNQEVSALSKKAVQRLINHVAWENIKTVHIYLPIDKNNELDSRNLIEYLNENYPHIKLYLPKLSGSVLFGPNTKLHVNRLGITEPEGKTDKDIDFDLMILPVVGFDRRGFRLGYGGGYYDKLLAERRPKRTIGLAFSFSEVDKIPEEPHDEKMDEIITEIEIIQASN